MSEARALHQHHKQLVSRLRVCKSTLHLPVQHKHVGFLFCGWGICCINIGGSNSVVEFIFLRRTFTRYFFFSFEIV